MEAALVRAGSAAEREDRLSEARRACHVIRHLLHLAIQVELLAIFEYLSIRLICGGNERGHSLRDRELVFTRHYLGEPAGRLTDLLVLFRWWISLLVH